jgi:hypothetical protein
MRRFIPDFAILVGIDDYHCAQCAGNKPAPQLIVSVIEPNDGRSARRKDIMANDRDYHEDGVSRRHALADKANDFAISTDIVPQKYC